MSWGAGKYDDLCTMVRETTGADGVLVVVLGGHKGNGFSCQTDLASLAALPELLEMVARQIREHGVAGTG